MSTVMDFVISMEMPLPFQVKRVSDVDAVRNAFEGRPFVGADDHSEVTATVVGDAADWSETGAVLASAFSQTDIRWDRVQELRQSIASGTYRVPAEAVAGSVLNALASVS